MFTDKLDLGFAAVRATVNNKPVAFETKKNLNGLYRPSDDTKVYPEGCVDIMINVLPYQVGDVLRVEFDRGAFACDGGGENRMNIVGEIGEYTVAMGAPDYDDNEARYNENWPKDMYAAKFFLPYEHWGFSSRGFEFHIVDTPKAYLDRFYRTNIVITVAWERSNKAYAWNIISFLTS